MFTVLLTGFLDIRCRSPGERFRCLVCVLLCDNRKLPSLSDFQCRVVFLIEVVPIGDQNESDMPEEHARKGSCLAKRKYLIDGCERIVEIVDIPDIDACKVESLWVYARPILGKFVCGIPSVAHDEFEHLLAESPAFYVKIHDVPKILHDPALVRQYTQALVFEIISTYYV